MLSPKRTHSPELKGEICKSKIGGDLQGEPIFYLQKRGGMALMGALLRKSEPLKNLAACLTNRSGEDRKHATDGAHNAASPSSMR